MLFNSYEFLLVFLPVVVIGFYVFGRFTNLTVALLWLIFCSLFFHAYWKASYTWLFVGSMAANYLLGLACLRAEGSIRRKVIVTAGIVFNLVLIGYFKYAGFISDLAVDLFSVYWNVGTIVLPLAISFYTFQQIAFLVDCYRRQSPQYTLLQYVSYLAFFPHLIAGPIVRHDDLVGQLSRRAILDVRWQNLFCGVAIVLIGLFKKVILADGAAGYANPIFAAAHAGAELTFLEAWLGAMTFAFVIYFDFSGYSDMAIGLARLFNVKLPVNFASPYKSTNIIQFWRRWHITLSNFLRDYLYIPLGGNRRGPARRHVNVLITMLLGGLWHGAGWNFIVWGGLHGCYLISAHLWHAAKGAWALPGSGIAGRIAAHTITFLAVVMAWVFFRAPSVRDAVSMLGSMTGFHGISLPVHTPDQLQGILHSLLGNAVVFKGLAPNVTLPSLFLLHPVISAVGLCAVLTFVVMALPNTQQMMRLLRPALYDHSGKVTGVARLLVWRPSLLHVGAIAALGFWAMTRIENVRPFIYFRF